MITTMRLSKKLIPGFMALLILLVSFYAMTDQKILRSSLSNVSKVSSSNPSKEDTLFHQASRVAYQQAIQSWNSTIPRQKFDLTSWEHETSGGLQLEDRQFLGDLYYNANSLFEFGLGESTYIAAKTGVPRYAGVDSDPQWVAMARKNAQMDHFRFYFADIGKTKEWGYPLSVNKKNTFQYQLAALSAEEEPFDVYLVDGRYRVACVLVSFLHAYSHGADMRHVKVAMHDGQRPGYRDLEKVVAVVDRTEKFRLFKMQGNHSAQVLYDLWEKYRSVAA